ncbi:MAG TPA: DUF6349 family protein [Mycobacterium sp.]|nr:DUF6349 family protein [Mycobacterium sp.]
MACTFARLAALEQWQEHYGHFDCYRRSHAWHAQLGAMRFGGDEPSDMCRPTILSADLCCDHHNQNCSCVGDIVYRGACLHCDWEGPLRDCENTAAEDAHDYAWSGWRDLPLVPRPPNRAPTPSRSRRWPSGSNK